MIALNYQLVVELRAAAHTARERSLVKVCNRYLRGLDESCDATADQRALADACRRLLGREVQS